MIDGERKEATMDEHHLRQMSKRISVMEDIISELAESNTLLKYLILGDPKNKVPGQVQLNKEIFDKLHAQDDRIEEHADRINFINGAVALGALITPILLGFILYQLS